MERVELWWLTMGRNGRYQGARKKVRRAGEVSAEGERRAGVGVQCGNCGGARGNCSNAGCGRLFLPGKLRRVAEEFEKHPQAGMVYHARLNLEAETGTYDQAEILGRWERIFGGR